MDSTDAHSSATNRCAAAARALLIVIHREHCEPWVSTKLVVSERTLICRGGEVSLLILASAIVLFRHPENLEVGVRRQFGDLANSPTAGMIHRFLSASK
jgi:hypothetical protein